MSQVAIKLIGRPALKRVGITTLQTLIAYGLLFTAGVSGPQVAAAAPPRPGLIRPDLAIGVFDSPAPAFTGGVVTYTVRVGNQECDWVGRVVCVGSTWVNGVDAKMILPPYFAVVGLTADSGFNCVYLTPGVTVGGEIQCIGGRLAPMQLATIAVQVHLQVPCSRTGTYAVQALVDQWNFIVERNEANNRTAVTTTVNPSPSACQ